ncbi:hypothetical protein GIY23_13515 [Allosaccharopolyspora coralli]|uniref:Protein kinase domain-containing protein n=1 Tax=Allosaccharopolyspora coralli TaxID=2665642 RepID=A0A5Q3Q7R6_9PSEU|nr:class IV lanthionine synthetase LanL [Allosaccharopolyspora coralli]QGK70403.1 hypothetical protein GIY23_13515 [Allosaccharopolyspora coralli]
MGEVPSDCPGPDTERCTGDAPKAPVRPFDAEFHFSVVNSGNATATDDSVLSDSLEAALRTTSTRERWTVTNGGPWCAATPEEGVRRTQGWKLHVSATPVSAPDVLDRALPVLLEAHSPFKFTASRNHLAMLNDRHTSRGHSGKFLTVYPDSDQEAVELAERLHEATDGLAGPRVLSDRPYRPESLVHYRYGAFVEQRRLSHDGFYAWVIEDPEGNPVEDKRVGQYVPPDWVTCPFPNPPAAKSGDQPRPHSNGVLIGDRFLAKEAIRHTNRGGVYRATDTETGEKVIVKEARPHVGTDRTGCDERDRLRTEARALEHLAPSGLSPRVISLFEQATHVFLAEEHIPGTPMRNWVEERIRSNGWRQAIPDTEPMARRVVSLLRGVHDAGMVVRDFTPNNIMVLPDGELRLIDLELAVPVADSEVPGHVGTPGFSAPEQLRGAAPDPRADFFSLGATLCFLAIGDAPVLVEDSGPGQRSPHEALTEWLTARWHGTGLPDAHRTLVLDLMRPEPADRPTAVDAATVLREPRSTASPRSPHRLAAENAEHAIDGLAEHLLATMQPDADRLWPVSCAHGSPDPCSVQHGAAGVLGVLTRCRALGVADTARLDHALATAGDWITARMRTTDGRPPGLYFGEAGIAWALHDAAEQLGDERLAAESRSVAARLPVAALNPDITHGTAGIGLTLLRLWQRTGDPELLANAAKSADHLVASALDGPDGLSWATPAEAHSKLAGRRYHGFAHGTAGVGYFLAATAEATGDDTYRAVATRAGETLLHHAIPDSDMGLWGAGTGDPATAPHWCHGASGIGTFLARLYRLTGDDRYRTWATMSARAVVESSSRGVLAQCHGLSGNAEFLLDLHEITGDRSFMDDAHRVARLVHSSRTYQDSRVVFPDERGGLTSTWGDGMPGVLSFLLRLVHGGGRMWMVDPATHGSTT